MSDQLLRLGPCEVDLTSCEVRLGGEVRAIEPRAFSLLACLAHRRDQVVTKQELLNAVWSGKRVSDAALAQAVKKVRQAIGDTGEPGLIRTLPRVGYRLVTRQTAAPAAAPAAPVRIALLPFENATGDASLEWIELGLMSMVTHAIAPDARLSIVAVQSLLAAVESARAAGIDVVDAVRRVTGAQVVVQGRVSRVDGEYELAFEVAGDVLQSRVCAARPGDLIAPMALAIEELLFPGGQANDISRPISHDPLVVGAFARSLHALAQQKFPQAANLLRMALGLAPGNPAVQLELLRALCKLGDLDGSKSLARRLFARAERTGELLLAARAHLALAVVHLHHSSFVPAAFHTEHGLRLMADQGPLDEAAQAQLLRSQVAAYRLDYADAEQALEQMRGLCERSGNRLLQLSRLLMVASVARSRDDYECAAEQAVRAAHGARELHLHSVAVTAGGNAAADLVQLGRWSEAVAHAEEAFAAAVLLDDPVLICLAVCGGSWVYRLAGVPAASQRMVDALPPADELPPLTRQWALAARCHFAAAAGDHAQAAQLFEQALRQLREDGNRFNEQDVLPWLLCSLVRCGRLDDAAAELEATMQPTNYQASQQFQRWLLHGRALLAHARGQPEQALVHLLELADAPPTPLWRAWAVLDAAWLQAEAGRGSEALVLLQRLPAAFAAHPLTHATTARAHLAAGDRTAAQRLHQRCLEVAHHGPARAFMAGLSPFYARAEGVLPQVPCLPSQL